LKKKKTSKFTFWRVILWSSDFWRHVNWYIVTYVFKEDISIIGVNLLNPTGYVIHQHFNIQQLYVLSALYLCVLYLSENKTATCATYSINWFVFITEMKDVYSAVRTGSLNKAVCALFNIQQLYVLSALYLCVLYLSENKQRLVPLTA